MIETNARAWRSKDDLASAALFTENGSYRSSPTKDAHIGRCDRLRTATCNSDADPEGTPPEITLPSWAASSFTGPTVLQAGRQDRSSS
jgi:HD-like signal output (HDOD) protein